jgi:hypothetical protein
VKRAAACGGDARLAAGRLRFRLHLRLRVRLRLRLRVGVRVCVRVRLPLRLRVGWGWGGVRDWLLTIASLRRPAPALAIISGGAGEAGR